ncbi:hypothetical protein BC941DRAFT_506345 [Chlamydoabsidia padenii]|nr:hypothetical protein BC941DRAFT_506345 [Chlamydoabsidia padenii]
MAFKDRLEEQLKKVVKYFKNIPTNMPTTTTADSMTDFCVKNYYALEVKWRKFVAENVDAVYDEVTSPRKDTGKASTSSKRKQSDDQPKLKGNKRMKVNQGVKTIK